MTTQPVPWRESLVVFLVTLAIATGVVWRSETEALSRERQSAERTAETYGAAIQRNVERSLSATYPLAALVRQAGGVPAEFEQVANQLLPYYQGASALALAPRGVVRAIVPLQGNEKAIGHDLLRDPKRDKEAIRARDTGQLTLAGPFELVQGGLAAAGRLPVYFEGDQRKGFWGFVSVLIRFPDVLASADLGKLKTDGYAYELWRIHPDSGQRQSIATAGNPLQNPVNVRISVPNTDWVLSIAPTEGWHDPVRLAIKGALGLLICVLATALALSVARLRRQRAEIELRVEERTRELAQSEQRFRDIAHISADWIWEVDATGRYTFASESVYGLLGYQPHELLDKTPFDLMPPDEALRVGAAFGRIVADKAPFQNLENTVLSKDGSVHIALTNGMPILDGDGNLLGYRGVDRDITGQRQLEELIRQMAFVDNLTQLPNRRLLEDRLIQAIAASSRSGCYGAVMFLDLDNFKPANDEHGHGVGDLLLVEVAARLKRCVREMDTVARFGGDEFVVMLSALSSDRAESLARADAVAKNIQEAVSRPYRLRKRRDGDDDVVVEHCCSASIGVTLFLGHQAGPDVLLKRADAAMYAAKAAGRKTIRFADPVETP